MNHPQLYRMALTHFAAGGVKASSLAGIAADCGIPLADVITVHRGTDSLFSSAIAQALRVLSVELQVLADSEHGPAERLLMMIRRLATPADDEALALFAVFRELLDGSERATAAFHDCMHDGFDAFMRVIGEAQLRGEVKPLPPRFLMSVLLCGVVLPQLTGYGAAEGDLRGVHARDEQPDGDRASSPPRSALLAASLEALFEGISTAPAAGPACCQADHP